jgi:hypothetical protein
MTNAHADAIFGGHKLEVTLYITSAQFFFTHIGYNYFNTFKVSINT